MYLKVTLFRVMNITPFLLCDQIHISPHLLIINSLQYNHIIDSDMPISSFLLHKGASYRYFQADGSKQPDIYCAGFYIVPWRTSWLDYCSDWLIKYSNFLQCIHILGGREIEFHSKIYSSMNWVKWWLLTSLFAF